MTNLPAATRAVQTISGRGLRSAWQPDWFSLVVRGLSLLTAALILYPLAVIFYNVFVAQGGSLPATLRSIAESDLATVLLNTALVIGGAVLFATGLGSLLAWLVERTDVGIRRLARILPLLSLFVPPIAGAIGWVLLASPRTGFLNRWVQNLLEMVGIETSGPLFNIFSGAGLVFVFAIYLTPNVFITVSNYLRNLDPALEEAARMSGAGLWQTLIHITIPSVRPAAFAGMLLSLIMGLSLFSLPVVIGGPARIELLSVRIVNLMVTSYPPQTGTALVLALVVAGVILLASWAQRRVLRGGNFATIGGRGVGHARIALGLFKWPARLVFLVYIAASALLPFVALVIVSLQPFWTPSIRLANLSFAHYRTAILDSGYVQSALLNSMWLGAAGATIGAALAAVIAYDNSRNPGRFRTVAVDAITKLPGAVSHLVIGIAFVVAFSGPPFRLYGTTAILLLAYLVLYMPQASLSATTAMHQVGRQLSEAAQMAGASQASTFRSVILPITLPSLVSAWALLFVLMSGDITASAMLAGNRNPVVGFVILDLWVGGSFPQIAALGTVTTLINTAVVLVALRLSRQHHSG